MRTSPPDIRLTNQAIEELSNDLAVAPERLRAARRRDRLSEAVGKDDGYALCCLVAGELTAERRKVWRTIRRLCRRRTAPPGLIALRRMTDPDSGRQRALARFELARLLEMHAETGAQMRDLADLGTAVFGRRPGWPLPPENAV